MSMFQYCIIRNQHYQLIFISILGEEDWEAELREELGAELGDYEVVSGTNKDNDQWEEEIQNMIDDEDSGDLR